MKGENLKNTISVKDKTGKKFRVKKDDPRYLRGELVGINKGLVIVRDKDGNKFAVKKDDPRYLIGELVGHTKGKKLSEETKNKIRGKLSVKDKDGNNFFVSKNDSRYLSGELKHMFQDRITLKDSSNNIFSVKKDDSRYLKGELMGINKGNEMPDLVINKIITSFDNNRSKKYKNFKGKIEKSKKNFQLNGFCKHEDILITPQIFDKLYKGPNDFYCEKCNEKIISNILLSHDNIKFENYNNGYTEEYIKRINPFIYANILKNSIKYDIPFHEKIYLYKNKLSKMPICIEEKCDSHTSYSKSVSAYNLYCDKHFLSYKISSHEKSLLDFISNIYDKKIINSYKINKKEIDIYLPDINVGIEFNGIYWHSDKFRNKSYHYDKWELCKSNNILLLNIWEDDWLYKQEIIKSIISNKIKYTRSIYARKTYIKSISREDSKLFLDKNHLQGNCISSINLGLFLDSELIGVMTFGKKRMIFKAKSNKDEYELLRFCNKLNTRVIGGASKFFKYFLKIYLPKSIISYANLDISDGALYEKLGFNEIGYSQNYWWSIPRKIRQHRSNFMKHILVKQGADPSKTENEIMRERGYYKIWGTGNLKYLYEKEKMAS